MPENPLGKSTDYPQDYSPERLFAIPRRESRISLALDDGLPFRGVDIWNAWELAWLDDHDRPHIATAEIRIDAQSDNLVESKSLKLYLGSLAETRFSSDEKLAEQIRLDLAKLCAGDVQVAVTPSRDFVHQTLRELPGTCIDDVALESPAVRPDASILLTDSDIEVDETVYSNLLRSHCPVTGQPDSGSIMIRYRGTRINYASLLRYWISFRHVSAFHETCVEQMFVDIEKACKPSELTVYARYNRRGGLDINPFRTNTNDHPENWRLWRQ